MVVSSLNWHEMKAIITGYFWQNLKTEKLISSHSNSDEKCGEPTAAWIAYVAARLNQQLESNQKKEKCSFFFLLCQR